MNDYPKITIVTPSFNDAPFLESAICSVIDQKYPNLEYIVIDGGSTDGSVDIIRRYEKYLSYWESKKDNGMYHAIQKGFEKSTGEIMGWLNSDDKHHPGCLFMIAQIFSDFKAVSWLQGVPNVIDEHNRIVYIGTRTVDRLSFYQNKHCKSRNYIQQESTFWRRSLWERAGGFIDTQYRFAGDFDLWIRFFKHETLFNCKALLAGFRMSKTGQASVDNYHLYCQETLKIISAHPLEPKNKKLLFMRNWRERFEWLVLSGYRKVLKALPKSATSIYNRISFDPASQKFKLK